MSSKLNSKENDASAQRKRDLARERMRLKRQDPEFKEAENARKRQRYHDAVSKERKMRTAEQFVGDGEMTTEAGEQRVSGDPLGAMQAQKQARNLTNKQRQRQNPEYRAIEKARNTAARRQARQDPAYRQKELEARRQARLDPFYKQAETMARRNARQDPSCKQKEAEARRKAREDEAYRQREREARRKARQDPAYRQKETEARRKARQDPAYRQKEAEARRKARGGLSQFGKTNLIPVFGYLTYQSQNQL